MAVSNMRIKFSIAFNIPNGIIYVSVNFLSLYDQVLNKYVCKTFIFPICLQLPAGGYFLKLSNLVGIVLGVKP